MTGRETSRGAGEDRLRRAVICAVIGVATALTLSAPAFASGGVEHLHFAAGPVPGHPRREPDPARPKNVPKPNVDGYMVRMAPNLHYASPTASAAARIPLRRRHPPPPRRLAERRRRRRGRGQRLRRALPVHGLRRGEDDLRASRRATATRSAPRTLDPQLHDPQPHRQAAKVYITYDIDFVPRARRRPRGSRRSTRSGWTSRTTTSTRCSTSSRAAAATASSRSRTWRGTRTRRGPPLNEFTVDHAGTLVGDRRPPAPGRPLRRPRPDPPGRRPRRDARAAEPDSVRLFRSSAHYFDKRGPDLVGHGDDRHAAELARRRSRPATCCGSAPPTTPSAPPGTRSMGIMVVWEAYGDGQGAVDPFTHKLDEGGHIHARPPGREQRPRRDHVR